MGEFEVYEMQDLPEPRIPMRSRLFHLEPMGIGTPYIESMSSYIVRLADAHCVPPYVLIRHEVLPLIYDLPTKSRRKPSSFSADWNTYDLNGSSNEASCIADVLNKLTLNNTLQYLTMTSWSEVFPGGIQAGMSKHWCPDCYDAWREQGLVVYDPLYWTLWEGKVCLRHRKWLLDACPRCRHEQSIRPQVPRLGYCQHCGCWLGAQHGNADDIEVLPEELVQEEWEAHMIGELIAAAPSIQVPPQKERIGEIISVWANQLAGGDVSTLARKLGIRDKDVDRYGWRQGDAIFPFMEFVHACYQLEISPLNLLTTKDVEAVSFTGTSNWLALCRKKEESSQEAVNAEIAQGLEEALTENPPPNMAKVARRLGYTTQYLRQQFPELCRTISANYCSWQRAKEEEEFRTPRDELRIITYALHSRGVFPSLSSVKAHMSDPCQHR